MPPHSSNLNICSAITLKTLRRYTKPKPTQQTQNDVISLLQKCKNASHLNQVHAHFVTTGLLRYPPLASKLVASFALSAEHGTSSTARLIADRVYGLDSYTWNTIIRGSLEGNESKEAFLVYSHMRKNGFRVDSFTLLFVIKACGLMSLKSLGEQIHAQICKLGFLSEIIIQTALLHFYGLFGRLGDMQQMFDEMPQRDLITWNTLISAYSHQHCHLKVIEFLHAMIIGNLSPNEVTLVCVISALSSLKALREGKAIHCYVIRNLVEFDVFVDNALVDMYSKCGKLLYAFRIFRSMPFNNVVSWTSMINGYSENNRPSEALALFKEMESKNIKPDEIIMLSVVSMCSRIGSFELGEWIDHYVQKNVGSDKESVSMENALIDMHSKCGNIKKACEIFDGISERTLVSWTSIIHGLALHGLGTSALVRFSQMQREGFTPDEIVFVSIISACSHSGLVNEGKMCFESMIKDYHLQPWMEHYGCMVDLLCRAGLIKEAFEFIVNMPVKPDAIMRRILMRACQNEDDINLVSRVVKCIEELGGPESSDDYVLLSNLYAMVSRWDRVRDVRKEMIGRGIVKCDPGCSSLS